MKSHQVELNVMYVQVTQSHWQGGPVAHPGPPLKSLVTTCTTLYSPGLGSKPYQSMELVSDPLIEWKEGLAFCHMGQGLCLKYIIIAFYIQNTPFLCILEDLSTRLIRVLQCNSAACFGVEGY